MPVLLSVPVRSSLKYTLLKDEEIDILLKDLLETHGYDFTYYFRDSLKRRISRLYKLDKFGSFDELRRRLYHDAAYIDHFIDKVTVNVTEMFRDPSFFKELKEKVLPLFAQHNQIRIWHAGCSTGEEVYSMAIFLKEAGLLDKTMIYATDINPRVLEKARLGIFPVSLMRLYAKNYVAAGGCENFSSYYTTTEEGEQLIPELISNVEFSLHNLASGIRFNEFHMIICRNVLIYFDKPLQDKVFELFNASLLPQSYLALGEKETINFSSIYTKFRQTGTGKIWKRIK